MAIPDSDPRAKDLDAAFAAAMEAPAKPRAEAKPPAEVDHDAPHGRDESGEPLAPYGYTLEGKPKRTQGGRPRKDDTDRPRTATVTQIRKPDAQGKAKAKPEPHDYSGELDGLATAAWFGLSAVGKVSDGIPVVGRLLPGRKLTAQAWLLSETAPRIISAVNLAAQHNAKAAKFCASLEGGDGLWALTCMFMVMPVVSLSATIWRGDDKAIKEAELPTFDEMAEQNDAKMAEMLSKIEAQITASVQPAAPQPEPAAAG